jgi:phosphohistidine phosphatase
MKLLVIRHGIAQEREHFAESEKPDDLRPLTTNGRRRMARNAEGIRALVGRIDFLATSPLVRARQTAAIIAKEYHIDVGDTSDALVPGASMDAFVAWAAPHAEKEVVAIVGHEPHLSSLITWLVSGQDESHVELRKGGAGLLGFSAPPARGSAILLWLLTPRALRQIAG